jgi:hypothetical protein
MEWVDAAETAETLRLLVGDHSVQITKLLALADLVQVEREVEQAAPTLDHY